MRPMAASAVGATGPMSRIQPAGSSMGSLPHPLMPRTAVIGEGRDLHNQHQAQPACSAPLVAEHAGWSVIVRGSALDRGFLHRAVPDHRELVGELLFLRVVQVAGL